MISFLTELPKLRNKINFSYKKGHAERIYA